MINKNIIGLLLNRKKIVCKIFKSLIFFLLRGHSSILRPFLNFLMS